MPRLPRLPRGASVRQLEQAEDSYHGYLHQWSEAGSPTSPVIVFVGGFLTESRIDEDVRERLRHWRDGLLEGLPDRKAEVWTYAWPSRELLSDVMSVGSLNTRALAHVLTRFGPRLRGVGIPVAVLLALATAGVGRHVLGRVLLCWEKARFRAEQCQLFLANECAEFSPRRVVLLGHSLGGRMVLRAAESSARATRTVHGIVSLAPAVESDSLDWSAIGAGSHTRPLVVHSRHDTVLKTAFRLAEFTRQHAVGLAGPGSEASRHVDSLDAGDLGPPRIGHNDYKARLPEVLRRCSRRLR